MKKSAVSLFALLLILIVTGLNPAFPAPPEAGLEHGRDFDRELLEIYYRKAEKSADEIEWRRIVEQGIGTVTARWESAVLLAAEDPAAIQTAVAGEKALLQAALGQEENERLSAFLVEKFFRGLQAAEVEGVLQAVEEANGRFLYARGGDDQLLKDEAGDPVLKKGEGFGDDLIEWRAIVRSRITEVSAAWESRARSLWDEIGPGASPELLASGGLEGDFEIRLLALRQGMSGELERIRALEERAFTEKRLSDQYSLRKKTDEEAAALTAADLIAEAEAAGEEGIRRVRDGLDDLRLDLEVKGVDLDSSNWLQSFEREFDRGLGRWESAEREFLKRRADWEKEAGIRFEAGEREWALAFRRLKEARVRWEGELWKERERGLRLWQEKADQLQVSMSDAVTRLEQAASRRSEGVGLQIQALLDMYLQASTVAATAKTSIEFWTEDIKKLIAEHNQANGDAADLDVDAFINAMNRLAHGDEAAASDAELELNALAATLQSFFAAKESEYRIERIPEFARLYGLWQAFLDANGETGEIVLEVNQSDYMTACQGGDGYSYPCLDDGKCAGRVSQAFQSLAAVDGKSIQTFMSLLSGFAGPSMQQGGDLKGTFSRTVVLKDAATGAMFYTSQAFTASYWNESWRALVAASLANEADHFEERAADSLSFINELEFWLGQQKTYAEYMEEAQQSLARTYGLILGDDRPELGVDGDGTDWSTVLLNDFQRELLIAKGESNYWRKQVEIAQAVHDYATDASTNRPTEAETQADYQEALAALQAAEGAYRAAVANLESLSNTLNSARGEFEAAKTACDNARAELERREAAYQEKMGVLMSMGDEHYRNRVQSQYAELLAAYGLKSLPGTDSLTEIMAEYRAALLKYGEETQAAASVRELTVLLQGNAEDGSEGLSRLKERLNAWDSAVAFGTEAVISGAIERSHPLFQILNQAVEVYNALPDGMEKNLKRREIEGLCAQARMEAEAEYNERLKAIGLLTTDDFSAWRTSFAGGLTRDEIHAQAEGAESEYLWKKADAILSALNLIDPEATPETEIARLFAMDAPNAKIALEYLRQVGTGDLVALKASLAAIKSALAPDANGNYQSLSARKTGIKTLTDANDIAFAFFRDNGNVFGPESLDYADLFRPELPAARREAEAGEQVLSAYAGLALCFAAENRAKADTAVRQYLTETGLGTGGESIELADPEAVWQAVATNGTITRARVLEILQGYSDKLATLADEMPEWTHERLGEYLENLSGYFTLKLLMAEKPSDQSWQALADWHDAKKIALEAEQRALEAEMAERAARLRDLRGLESALANNETRPLSRLGLVYAELEKGGTWVSESGQELSLSLPEAEEMLVDSAALLLAESEYSRRTGDLDAQLSAIAGIHGIAPILAENPALRESIKSRAAALMGRAESIDQALITNDFRNVSGPEASYALFAQWKPEDVYAETAAADADLVRSVMGMSGREADELRALLGLPSLECVAGIRGEGLVYSRALYLGLRKGGFEGAELQAAWEFLCGVYGLTERDENIAALCPAAGGGDEQGMFFCYSGSSHGQTYFLKNLILCGGDAASYLARVNAAGRADIESFQQKYILISRYLPGVDGDKFDYAGDASGAVALSALGSLLEIGIDDPFFMERADGGGWLALKAAHAEGRVRNLAELFARRCALEDEALASESGDAGRLGAQIARELELVERWLGCQEIEIEEGVLAKVGFNYRSSLSGANLEPEAEEEEALESKAVTALAQDRRITDDGGGGYLFHYYEATFDRSGYLNEELDQYNALLLEADSLERGFSEEATAPAARIIGEYFTAVAALDLNAADFQAFTDTLARNASLKPDEEGMNAAGSAYVNARERIALLKNGAASAGETLAAINLNRERYQAEVLLPLQTEISGLRRKYDEARAALAPKEDAFNDANAASQAAEAAMKTTYDALESARLELEKREQILLYAKSMYLKPDGSDASGPAVDPAQKLTQARFEADKASRAYETLKGLFAAAERRQSVLETNAALRESFTDYGNAYRQFLKVKEAQRLIDEALQIQYGNVERARQEAYKALAKLGGAGSLNLVSLISKTAEMTDEDDCYENDRPENEQTATEYWLRFFNLPGEDDEIPYGAWAQGFNPAGFPPSGLFPDAPTEEQLAGLRALQDKAKDYTRSEQFMKDFEAWGAKIAGLAAGDPGAYEAMMAQWENAFYYLMAAAIAGSSEVTEIETYADESQMPIGRDEWGNYIFPTAQRTVIKKAIRDKYEVIRGMAAPFVTKEFEIQYWWNGNISGGSNTTVLSPVPTSFDSKILNGKDAFAAIMSSQSNGDFGFFVFLAKSGVLIDSPWRQSSVLDRVVNGWPGREYYRVYSRIDGEVLANIKELSDKYHAEQATLTLLENGNADKKITAAMALNAVVTAAKLVKPEGFDFSGENIDETLRTYYRGVIESCFSGAQASFYGENAAGQALAGAPSIDGKTMAEALGLLTGEAARARMAAKDSLELGIDGIIGSQNQAYDEYRLALEALRNTASASGLDAAQADLAAKAEAALKNCAYQTKDVLVAFCRLYDVLIGEYVGGIDPAGNPFDFTTEREASLTVKSAIYGDVRDLMGLKQEAMLALYRERLAGAMAVQRDEMRLKLAALNERRDDWAAKMTAILERGREEWTRANRTFETAWRGWAESFQNEYEDKAERWNDDYLALETSKNEWIADAERKLVQAGTEGVAEELGAAAEEKIAVAMSRLIGDVSGPAVNAEDVVARLTGNELFKRISSYASLLAKGVERIGTDVGVTLAGRDLADSAVMGRVEEFLADRREEISRHTGAITARTAEQAVEKAIEDLTEQVTAANESVDANIDYTMHTSGFTRNGATYSRNAITGSSLLGGDEHETQTLEAYRYFIAPRFRSGVDLRDEAVREMGQEGINALVAKAVRNLRTQFESIMGGGDEDDEATTLAAEAPEKKKSLYEMWVGEAAELDDNPNPRDIRYKSDGTGEMGRIFKSFLAYEVKRNAGEAEARSSFYTKPLWNDTNMPFEAPSLRSIVDIGMTIVGTVFTSGIGGVLWNMIDDAIFTAADIAGGMDVGQAGLAFLKKAGGSLISFGVGEIGKVVGGALKLGNDAGGVIGKTLLKGAESFTTNAASGLLNAIEFDSSGQLTWNANSYTEQLWGQKALAGYAGGMASTFMSGVMATGNLRTNGGVDIKKGAGIDAIAIGDLNKIVGSGAGMLTEYMISGQTTMSLLRINDVGILEMRLGGGGKLLGLGMGGYDMSLGTLVSAVKGIEETEKVWEWKRGGIEKSRKLDLVAGAAYSEDAKVRENAGKVWGGLLNISFEDVVDEKGNVGLGKFDQTRPDTIVISKMLLGSTLEDTAKLVSVFAHEGTHYDGNRIETVAHMAGLMTYLNLASAFGTRDEAFVEMIANEIQNEKNQKENTGKTDYWILTKDGRLINDKQARLKIELAGGGYKELGKDEKDVAQALVHYLGAERAKELLNRQRNAEKNAGDLTGQIGTYDDQTLMDVLKVSKETLKAARGNPTIWAGLMQQATQSQKEQLLGEALMKGQGMRKVSSMDWRGQNDPKDINHGFTLSDTMIDDYSIGMRELKKGLYERFTVTAMAVRGIDAFKALKWTGKEWVDDYEYRRNTSIVFVKQDLEGKVLGLYDVSKPWSDVDAGYGKGILPINDNGRGRWNTIDVGHGQSEMMPSQPFDHEYLDLIQGNTVNSDYLIRLSVDKKEQWGVDQIFLVTNADTIGDKRIQGSGVIPDSMYRENRIYAWLWHPSGRGGNDGCWVILSDPDFKGVAKNGYPESNAWKDKTQKGSAAWKFDRMTTYLKNDFGIYNGLNIRVKLYNDNPWAVTGRGLKGWNR